MYIFYRGCFHIQGGREDYDLDFKAVVQLFVSYQTSVECNRKIQLQETLKSTVTTDIIIFMSERQHITRTFTDHP